MPVLHAHASCGASNMCRNSPHAPPRSPGVPPRSFGVLPSSLAPPSSPVYFWIAALYCCCLKAALPAALSCSVLSSELQHPCVGGNQGATCAGGKRKGGGTSEGKLPQLTNSNVGCMRVIRVFELCICPRLQKLVTTKKLRCAVYLDILIKKNS